MLWSMEWQRARHDLATEQQQSMEMTIPHVPVSHLTPN